MDPPGSSRWMCTTVGCNPEPRTDSQLQPRGMASFVFTIHGLLKASHLLRGNSHHGAAFRFRPPISPTYLNFLLSVRTRLLGRYPRMLTLKGAGWNLSVNSPFWASGLPHAPGADLDMVIAVTDFLGCLLTTYSNRARSRATEALP